MAKLTFVFAILETCLKK